MIAKRPDTLQPLAPTGADRRRTLTRAARFATRLTLDPLEPRTLMSATWSTVDTRPIGEAYGMTSDAAGNVYAAGVGSSDQVSPWEGVIREKAAGGTTWTQILDVPNTTLRAIAVDANGDIYASGSNANGWAVMERRAGQTTFTVVDSVASGYSTALAIDSSGNVYAVGYLNIYTTVHGKTSEAAFWAVRKQTGGTGAFVTVDQVIDGTNGINCSANGVTVIASGPSAGIYVVGNAGAYWNEGMESWYVRKSTDGGHSWSTVDHFQYDPNANSIPTAVAGDNAGNVYVVGSGETATITGYTGNGKNRQPVYAYSGDWIVRKGTTSSSGAMSWSVNNDLQNAHPLAMGIDPAGAAYVVGYTWDANKIYHAIVQANTGTNATGVPNGSWVTVDDYANSDAYRMGFTSDSAGNHYVCGADSADNWFVRSDASSAPLGVQTAAALPSVSFDVSPAAGTAPLITVLAAPTFTVASMSQPSPAVSFADILSDPAKAPPVPALDDLVGSIFK